MIYFASDTHLGAGTPDEQRQTEKRFTEWLDRIAPDCEVLVLMGDIFDFWFEYKRVVPQGFVRTLGRLAALTDRGVRVIFLCGNHDMWIGDYLNRECGVELYTTPQTLSLGGRTLFLAHGDNMRIKRFSLLKLMNTLFRSEVIRWLFRWLVHPDLALRFGHWWSGKSRKSHSRTPLEPSLVKPLGDYARDHAALHPEVDHYIFGHMHVAVDHTRQHPSVLHLGAWDGDYSYATLDAEGLKLHHIPHPEKHQ